MLKRHSGEQNKILSASQAMLVMAFAVQILWPRQMVVAANRVIDTVGNGNDQASQQEVTIRQADPSLVMLTGTDLAQAQEQWQAGLHAPKKAVDVRYMTLSAYNSEVNQCDGSPYATAIGSLTRDGVVAASPNLPIGTRVRFPDQFGDKEFRVEDRMNTRYQNNIDIWMENHADAVKFGRRYAKIEIVAWGKGRGMD